MKITSKKWFAIYLIIQIVLLAIPVCVVGMMDPYFHYHKPITDKFYYTLHNQRSQNYGIVKNFDYNAIITGTSMVENFKSSEADEIFNVASIKIPFSGARYKEINDCLKRSIQENSDIKLVIRCLDLSMLCMDKEAKREDLGTYPTYLYNDNLLDDVEYVYNRDIIFNDCWWMIKNRLNGGPVGISSFDTYSYWMHNCIGQFGCNNVLKNRDKYEVPIKENESTEEEKELIRENIEHNVLSTVKENPNIKFYYFFPPYSAAWWGDVRQAGGLSKQIEMEKYAVEMLLGYDNLNLYSFNTHEDITTDLNNYKDSMHYGEWINSDILKYMNTGIGLLTKENYMHYLEEEYKLYSTFDYNSLFEQEDKEDLPADLM